MILDVFQGRYFLMRMLLLIAVLLLVCIGILTIYSIGHPAPIIPEETTSQQPEVQSQGTGPQTEDLEIEIQTNAYTNKWQKQFAFAGAGLVCLVLVNLFNYQRLGPISYALYTIVLISLAVLLVDRFINLPFVHERFGIRRWYKIGFGFLLQPSEFCKIAFILALAWYLRFRSNYRTFNGLVGPFALTLLAMILIILEPDLGTTVLMMPILFTMLFVAGAKVKHLIIILLIGIAVSPIIMRPYQRARITSVFLQNDKIFAAAEKNEKLAKILVGDPDNLRTWKADDGFQLLHAKRAIASGGIMGYGFRQGPYIQHREYLKLPEPDNDMIFPIIAHQFGIIGCIVVLIAYIVIITCAIELAWLNPDPFGRLVAVGIAAMIAIQVLVNVGMTLGLMPITGLTLPLVSYGGSSMVANMIAIGLLNNIGRHRPYTVTKKPFEFGQQ